MTTRTLAILTFATLLWGSTRADVGDNSVGMNIHVGHQSWMDACADLGVGWVRMDGNWFVLEPAQDDVYQWDELETWIDRATQAGLKVYLTLAYTPAWVLRHGDTDGQSHNDVPDTATEWTDFVHDAVAELRPLGVTHYGIWNEPNLTGFFEGTVQEYVDTILLPGAAAVRTGCQAAGYDDCVVLGPDLANVGEADDYLEQVLDLAKQGNGGVIPFDIIAHHSYNDFEETGWDVFSGDSFINMLDSQRCPFFCRRDLRQILDAAGWTGEVWITETGERAVPVGDAQAEDIQAIYVTRVLEEQLLRAWYTNSFFYEIHDCGVDQQDCTIDGYGLMRATEGSPGPGQRAFPADYRLKPAFWALRQFISDHPEIVGTQPPAQCGDGQDNDSDGLIDGADPGCADAFDDDEGDDPPPPGVTAYRTPGIQVDGDLTDLGPDGWLALGESDWHGTEPLSGAEDLAVTAAVRWDAGGLYIGLDVTDDAHENDRPPAELWLGDSLQIAFDVDQSGGLGYDDVDDHEINVALASGQVTIYRFHGPAGASDALSAAVVRSAGHTRYELHLDPTALPGVALSAGTRIGFSFLVNDADGAGRVGWIEWTEGIGMQKAPAYFGEIVLSAETSGPDDQDGGADGSDDGGVDGQDDGGPDAGADPGADQGSGDDGGPVTDAPLDDGGSDGSTGDDAPDAGGDAPSAGDQSGGGGGGCGCASSAPGSPLVLLLLAWSLVRRRRV